MKSTLILSTIGAAVAFAPVQTTTRTSTSLAFFGGAKKSTAKSSPLADEAVEIYTTKYNTGGTRPKFFFESWGMPGSYDKPDNSSVSIFERKTTELTSTFNTLATLYGEEDALKMVKIQPGVLAFAKENFGPSLDAFGEVFGYDESIEMVKRNPGLLSVNPGSAAAADGLTMQLSYVIDFTRPIGAAGPTFIVALLLIPALESATGVSRGELFSSLF